jgi:hypothetical protein
VRAGRAGGTGVVVDVTDEHDPGRVDALARQVVHQVLGLGVDLGVVPAAVDPGEVLGQAAFGDERDHVVVRGHRQQRLGPPRSGQEFHRLPGPNTASH